MTKYIIGLDLGQVRDYTALCVLEVMSSSSSAGSTSAGAKPAEIPKPSKAYGLKHLERFRDVSYPDVVSRVKFVMAKLNRDHSSIELVVDATGCGLPVVDMLRKFGLQPIAIQIHGGDRVTSESKYSYRVPKRDLVACLQVVTQTSRLKIPSKLKLSQVLQTELLNFRVKIDPATAHDSYSAWREADHDDLVLSVALACWYAETRPKPQRVAFYSLPQSAKIQPAYRIPGTRPPPSRLPSTSQFGYFGPRPRSKSTDFSKKNR